MLPAWRVQISLALNWIAAFAAKEPEAGGAAQEGAGLC